MNRTDIGGLPPRVVIPLLCPGVWNAISECWEIVLKLFLRWQFWWSLLKPLDYGWTSMKDSLFYGHLSLYKLKPLVFICWPRIGRYIGYLQGGLAIICDMGTGVQKFRGLVMSKIRQTLMTPKVQIWVFICWEWSPTIAEIWDVSGK